LARLARVATPLEGVRDAERHDLQASEVKLLFPEVPGKLVALSNT
jgi:hypothetical protein